MEKRKNLAVLLLLCATVLALGLWATLRAPEAISDSERRPLAQPPELTLSGLLSGSYAQQAEKAAPDQFPLREWFRSLKAQVSLKLLGQKDTNGIYYRDGHAAQLEYPQKDASLDYAAERIQWICDNLLTEDSRVFLSVIPDKNAFLAAENGYPALDYDAFIRDFRTRLPEISYIDLRDTLTLEDFYRTDLHWRQEMLPETAQKLAEGLGVSLKDSYTQMTLDTPFYGIYAGQSALPLEADSLCWLTSDTLEQCRVWNGEEDSWGPVYDLEKAAGRDPYELFLSGSVSLLRLENPNAETDRELVIFRDSFGSSIAPLLAEAYASITLVDIRYLPAARLSSVMEFHGQDVLFLYSVPVLNNSDTLK